MIENGGLFAVYCTTRIILLFLVLPSLFQHQLLELLKKCSDFCGCQFFLMMTSINLAFPIRIATFLAAGRRVNRNKSAALSPPLVSHKIVKILSNAVLIRDFSPCFLKIMNDLNDEKNCNNNYKHTIFLLFYNFHSASPKLFRIRS